MDLQADTMTQSMAKPSAEASFLDHTTRHRVDLFAGLAGPNRVDRPLLRFEHNSIYTFKFGRDFSCDDDTRQVARIEPAERAPINQNERRLAHAPRARPVMRQRRAIP